MPIISFFLQNFLYKAFGIINIEKLFQNFITDINYSYKPVLQHGLSGLSEPELYVDLVYKYNGRANLLWLVQNIIIRYKRIGYHISVARQSACLIVNPVTVNNFASRINCMPVGRAPDSLLDPHTAI